jgi:hypothetical protein
MLTDAPKEQTQCGYRRAVRFAEACVRFRLVTVPEPASRRCSSADAWVMRLRTIRPVRDGHLKFTFQLLHRKVIEKCVA